MPTRLDNGVLVFNSTPHPLMFWCEETATVVVAETDEIVNAEPHSNDFEVNDNYRLVDVQFRPNSYGLKTVHDAKREYPGVVIVGSIVAAIAYPGLVVMSVPFRGGREYKRQQRLLRSDKFTIFKQGESNVS